MTPLQPRQKWNFNINVFSSKAINFLHKFSELLFVILRTLIITILAPLVLLLIGAVETTRVYHGLIHVETDQFLAGSASFAIIFIYIVMRFVIVDEIKRSGQSLKSEKEYRRWTIGSFIIGIYKNLIWDEELKKVNRVDQMSGFVGMLTIFIIGLGVYGTLYNIMLEYKDIPFYNALILLLSVDIVQLFQIVLGAFLGVFLIIAKKHIIDLIINVSDKQFEIIEQEAKIVERKSVLSGFKKFNDFVFENKRMKLDQFESFLSDTYIKLDNNVLTILSKDLQNRKSYSFKLQDRNKSYEKIKIDWENNVQD